MIDKSPAPISEPQRMPPYRPKISSGDRVRFALLAVLLLTIVSGAIAAAVHIESIVGFGPIVALLGLVAMFFPFRSQWSLRVLAFSAPLFALAVFLTIFRLRWSPQQAQAPIGIAILAYLWVVIPAGIFLAARASLSDVRSEKRFQFGLRSLFVATLIAAVFAGIVRFGEVRMRNVPRHRSASYLTPIAIASAATLLVGAGLAAGYVRYRRTNLPANDKLPPT